MRQKIKLPRILKINRINDLIISVVFNNGESRIIDFNKVLKSAEVNESSPEYILFNKEEFSQVEIQNNTLSWPNVEQYIPTKNGQEKRVPYEIGADMLYEHSEPEMPDMTIKIGKLLKTARKKSGLTQEALAQKSGTTRTYISRIENDRSDLEIATLKKIVEIGLGKQLEISIK
jgi:DNA-binding XRE family transcriptional regulator